MTHYLLFAILGLGAGALYAALGQGVVLAYRGSGAVNLAHGAMAMYIAYTYAGLRQGKLMQPIPGAPGFITFGHPLSVAWAFVLSMAVAVVLGLLIHFLVFRPLRYAPPLAKTVASVGVLLVLQAIVILRFGTDSISMVSILSANSVAIGSINFPVDRIWFLGVAVVIALALMVVFRWTRLGIATRAASENERAAIFAGLSPGRLAATNWVMSSVIAGVVGILYGSLTGGLDPVSLVLYVVPALGAALLGRLESFGITALAGILLGVVQSILVPATQNVTWLPETGVAAVVAMAVVGLAMVLRGRGLPERGSLLQTRLPSSPRPRYDVFLIPLVAVVCVPGVIWLPVDLRTALINSMIGAVLALSLVVVLGFAGQVSVMQMGLAGVSVLCMTRLAGQWHLPFLLASAIAIVVTGVFGVIVGLPSLRVRGVHLAVLTLAVAYSLEQFVFDNTSIVRVQDANSIPVPELFGWTFGINKSPIRFGFFVLIVVCVCFVAVAWLRRSDLGRKLLAIRSNENAAASLGISVSRAKIIAFAIGSLLAGSAGVLLSYQFQGMTSAPYNALASVTVLAGAYLGGVSTLSGAVIAGLISNGGFIFQLIQRSVALGEYEPFILGFGLVLSIILNPEGIDGMNRLMVNRVIARFASRRRPHAAEPAAPVAGIEVPSGTSGPAAGRADRPAAASRPGRPA
jgi:ABC-type branched-subunit amino acid transport system permease subunit